MSTLLSTVSRAQVHESVASFQFGTKAETLLRLATLCPVASYCKQDYFSVAEWRENSAAVLKSLLVKFRGLDSLIVRSSSQNEDTAEVTMAGAYLSLPNIRVEAEELSNAIDRVIESYGRENHGDQILVQTMVQDVTLAGVIFTGDIQASGPYFVLNYDDWSGKTDAVTSGQHSKMILIRSGCEEKLRNEKLRKLVATVFELQRVTNERHLDVEFCFRKNNELVILQVRRLHAARELNDVRLSRLERAVSSVKNEIGRGLQPEDGLFGRSSVYSEMADWNPAEMIGISPSKLSASLYSELITNSVWSRARSAMGYKNVSGPLMTMLGGRPYIDVRRSLNSFLPKDISVEFGEDLLNWQLEKLREDPALHDKIEFQVAITCVDFSVGDRLNELRLSGFSKKHLNDFSKSITSLTNTFLAAGAEGIERTLAHTNHLVVDRFSSKSITNPKVRAMRLLHSTAEHGTLYFSQLARHGFVAVSLLKSLVKKSAISEDEADRFMKSINTVTSRFVSDLWSFRSGALSEKTILDTYGFLRPGTYDVTSLRYDEMRERLRGAPGEKPIASEEFYLSEKSKSGIQKLMTEAGLVGTPEAMFRYISASIAAREEAKFNFTHSLSDALSLLVDWASDEGLSRTDLSALDLVQIRNAMRDPKLKESIWEASYEYSSSRAIRLPSLIKGVDDTDIISVPLASPNFITSHQVVAEVQEVSDGIEQMLDGKIVLIEKADPGFDWIFGHRIAGLVTMYGGANSHMAIRCAEFGLPAAIGCGERIFFEIRGALKAELDCLARTLRPAVA